MERVAAEDCYWDKKREITGGAEQLIQQATPKTPQNDRAGRQIAHLYCEQKKSFLLLTAPSGSVPVTDPSSSGLRTVSGKAGGHAVQPHL